MASLTKFNCFCKDLAEGKHGLTTANLKIYLSNTSPNVTTHTQYDGANGVTGPAEISAGNGYTAGGNQATVSSGTQTAGVYKLVCNDPAVFTAAGGTVGPFQFAVIYNDSNVNKELIGYYDYGSAVTLQDTDSFAVDLDQTNGVLTIT